MEHSQKNQDKLIALSKAIDGVLEEGITYYAASFSKEYGTSGGTPYIIHNGVKSYKEAKELDEALDNISNANGLFGLTGSYPTNTKVKYTFRKGEIVKMEPFTPVMLFEEIKLLQAKEQAQGFLDAGSTIETSIKFHKKKKLQLEITEKRGSDEEIDDTSYIFSDDDIECLYKALDGELEMVKLVFENDELIVQSKPSYPEHGMGEIKEEAIDMTYFKPDSITSIYEYLESGVDAKITRALETLSKNEAFLKKAEQRYLSLIQARTNNPNAILLKDFKEGILNKKEVNILLGENIGDTFISYGMLDEEECKLIVDVIGSVIRINLKAENYIRAAKKTKNTKALKDLYLKYLKRTRIRLSKELNIYPDGWWSQIILKISYTNLRKVMFDHTSFDEANKSLVLKEYMFYMNLRNEYESIYFDIHQSDTPDLTEVFWLLPYVPTTNWSDVEPKFPDSPLPYKRIAKMREGDFGKWKSIKR